MSRIAAVMAGLVLVVSLILATKTLGQILTNTSTGTSTEPERQSEAKKNEPNWQAMRLNADNRFYLANLSHMRQELGRFQKDPLWGDMVLQAMGMEYPNIGRYQKALECFDRPSGRPTKPGQLASPDRYEPCDAVAAILELADKQQVIMINEAHHVPSHRALTLQLLDGLYRKGFRYFAAETLSVSDKNLQTRGYPTRMTGTFTAEPVGADMVRTALNLGYKVTPYECIEGPDAHPAVDPIPGMNFREQGQARNLKERILDQDPTAKIIVHAGYAHISKKVEVRKRG